MDKKVKHVCRIVSEKQKKAIAKLLKSYPAYSIDKIRDDTFQFVGFFSPEKYSELSTMLDSLEREF